MIKLRLQFITKQHGGYGHVRSTQRGIIFVQSRSNNVTSPLRYFEAYMPKKCQCVSIHSCHTFEIKFAVFEGPQ